MRMLQVCAVDFTAFHMLRPLMETCRADGWDVEFACSDGPDAARLRDLGFRHRSVPITRRIRPVALARAIVSLAADLRSDPPDLVHTHTPIGGLVGRSAAALGGCPLVIHTFHGLPLRGDQPDLLERAFLILERVVATKTRLFFSQGRADATRAWELGIARREDTIVIGNGVDLERFASRPHVREAVRDELRIPAEAIVILTVGRLVREKGLLDLAEAAYQMRNLERLHFIVVGSALPSDRSDISGELASHRGVRSLKSRWVQLGQRQDVDRLLQAADIFVLPSYREGLPRSLIEAMASGLAIVASDIPGCRELLDDEAASFLVPVGDTARLAHALAALAVNQDLRAAMGAHVRELAVARHDEQLVIRTQLDAIDTLIR